MTKVKTPQIPVESNVSPKCASAFAATAFEPQSQLRCLCEPNATFPHLLAAPVHYEVNYSYPLIVWLHDSAKSEQELFEVAPKISERNYVAVAPRGLERVQRRVIRSVVNGRLVDQKSWSEKVYDWIDSEQGVSEAEDLVFNSISQAKAKYNIHNRRIFLVGRGSGGAMALQIGLRNPREFAGVVSIDGAFPTNKNRLLRHWATARDLPILITTGSHLSTRAPHISPDELRLLHTAGMTVVIRQYNDQVSSPKALVERMNRILSDVNRWAMERALNPQSTMTEMFA